MKLESTLNTRPGMMHIAPLLDVIMLLLVFFLLSSNFVLRSGVEVTPPASRSVLETLPGADIIVVSAGTAPRIFFNDQEVDTESLKLRLAEEKDVLRRQVVVRADRHANYGTVMDIVNLVQEAGLDTVLGTNLENAP